VDETGPTVPRSIRFPTPIWKQLEARAKAEGLSLHSALRVAILEWARRA
jgi:predicted DNA-binding ribbon-helix-helix protein